MEFVKTILMRLKSSSEFSSVIPIHLHEWSWVFLQTVGVLCYQNFSNHKAKHVVWDSDRKIYCDLKKNCNRITPGKYQEKIASEIENLNSNDPQYYWRFWKKHKRNPGNFESINLRSFTDYYKTCSQISQNDLFDYDFMHNIEYLMKTYDEIAPLKLYGILNDILNGPI